MDSLIEALPAILFCMAIGFPIWFFTGGPAWAAYAGFGCLASSFIMMSSGL